MTVSFALRNCESHVSTETRERIVEIAKCLGYVPDARMAVRMSEVRNTKQREFLPIAWIDLDKFPGTWRRLANMPFFTGAKERCEELGYELQEFRVREPGMSAKRISQILYHRGIQGAIIAPPNECDLAHLHLNWQSMACASFAKGIVAPRMYHVTHDYYYNTLLALKLLRRFGYKRIGFVLQHQANRRSSHAIQAAVGYFQSTPPKVSLVPPFNLSTPKLINACIAHIKKYRPDVVVGQDSRLLEWVQTAGFKVPEQVGVVHMALDDDCLDWAGIFSRKKEIGAATANTVISLLQNNQFGLPKIPMDTLVPGRWQAGKTLLTPKPRD